MAQKAVLMKAFFGQLEAFTDALTKMYPDDADFSLFSTTVRITKQANPLLVIHTIRDSILPFKDQIFAKDESFFLERDYTEFEKDVTDAGAGLDIFEKLKKYVKDMSPASKDNVWMYAQNLLKLAIAIA